MKTSKGFTLVEVIMVVALIGIIIGATVFFLRGGLNAADSATENSVDRSITQNAASEIELFLGNLGYPGHLLRIEEPILELSENSISFYSNINDPTTFDLEDKIIISSSDGNITIQDGNGNNLMTPVPDAQIAFNYVDATGQQTLDPLAVRTVDFTITMDSGFQYNGYASPYNLELVGLSDEEYEEAFSSSGGADGRWELTKFEEDFEFSGTMIYEDSMEGELVWVPALEEDFESITSWANDWETWSSEPNGRVERYNESSMAYDGEYFLGLDCSSNGWNNNMAIWNVDLSSYIGDDLRLHYYWMESSNGRRDQDGVFLPEFIPGDTVIIDEEDFTSFRNDYKKGWTYWTNDYGRIVVTQDYPIDGNYLNMDSRRSGSRNYCRIMNSYDLSAYSSSSDVWLTFDFTDRGDENHWNDDFVGIMEGSIQDDPLARFRLRPQNYVDGSWYTIEVDLDELVPSGYDWSDFRIAFSQRDNDVTNSIDGSDGISIDNVTIINRENSEWQFINRMRQVPWNFSSWTEVSIDLDSASSAAGVPFSSSFDIGFGQRGNRPYPDDGIMVDGISIDKQEWGMVGWTHGVWDPYTVDEWEAVEDASNANQGSWYYAVGGTGNYTATPTQAWLEAPELDYTGYSVGDRIALSFFHKYDFSTGAGCNVKISDDDGATWNIIAPYYGYYESSVPGLSDEPGWIGTSYHFSTPGDYYQFGVFDVSAYAGKTIRVRFNYGIAGGSSAKAGWLIDGFRTIEDADWPQSIWKGTADWWVYTASPGIADPSTTPGGSRWAGNDMYDGWHNGKFYDTEHAYNTINMLVSPPVTFHEDNGSGDGVYSYIEFIGCPRIDPNVGTLYLLASAYSELAPDSYRILFWHQGYQANWGRYRFRVDNQNGTPPVWTANKTIVFRWALLSDTTSSPLLGGWNLDDIKCFTTDTYYPNLVNGVVIDNTDDETYNDYFVENRTLPASTFHNINSYAPVFTDEQATQERL